MATPNPARLSAIGNKTLTLAMERQRLLSISPPSHPLLSPAKTAGSSSSLGQITKNLATLRDGIVAIEEAQGPTKASSSLREQYSSVLSVLGEEEAAAAGLERYVVETSMALFASVDSFISKVYHHLLKRPLSH